MWPFKKKETPVKRGGKMMKRVIVGFVIGGAISSIIGSKLHRAVETEDGEEDEDDDDNDEEGGDDEDDE